MDTPLLKRRLNPFLLISTVVVLSLLAGLSVLYQSELNDLVTDRKNLSTQLEERNQEIAQLEGQVQNLSDRREELNTSVGNLKTNIGQIQNQLSDRENTISSLRNTLSDKNSTVEALRTEKATLNTTIQGLEQNMTEIENDFETVCEDSDNNLTQSSEDICDDRGF